MTGIERKLTTILAADVVSFSKLMGSDDTGTYDALKACRAVIDGCIAEYRGRVFGSAGDSVVAEFSSPVQAVLCANEFQKLLAERNEHFATKGKMQFRVGVNMGDVIIDGDNLYGEGVNVAARLESIADPGGICLSGKVYQEVKRKLDLSFVDGGAQQLKNIIDPVPVFHLNTQRASTAAGTGEAVAVASHAGATKAREADAPPTVAVLPLKVISGDDEIQSLVEGLHEDILGGLAKMTAITVLGGDGGDGGADFRLEGSARAAGRRLRLSFTLFDAATQSQAWQDLRGDFETALTHAETALDLNSSFALARAMVGICKCHLGEADEGLEMLRRATAASPEDPHRFRHFRDLAIAHFLAGQDAQALRVVNRLVHQAPELARNRLVLASLSWHAGRRDAARDCVAGLLRDQPELTLRNMRPVRFADPDMAKRYAQGLRDAGLPEGA